MTTVLIDSGSIRDKPSGVAFYTYNLIKALLSLENQTDYQIGIYRQPSLKNWLKQDFNHPKILAELGKINCLPLPVTITNLFAPYLNNFFNFDQNYLGDIDIIHGTDHYVYPCRRAKKIMTIHDLTFLKYPFYSNKIVQNYTKRINKCLPWTDLIITFSQNSKQDIIKYFSLAEDRVIITSEASRYSINQLNQEKIKFLKNSFNYDFSKPYLLFVSTLEPRKNIVNLIKSFNFLKQQDKIPHQLVLIGQKGWNYEKIFQEINQSKFKQEIHYLGYLNDELVALFYTLADVFIYPSFYEGFGLPVLEAMTLGTPVVTSHTSSLPEVAGNAAIYINPEDAQSIAEGVSTVINNRKLRADLISKGKARASLYSWQRVAEETINAYQYCLSL
jgi:glycosyltransferase involved in cell wall biosynthesis